MNKREQINQQIESFEKMNSQLYLAKERINSVDVTEKSDL